MAYRQLLILGGTSEANQLVRQVVKLPNLKVILSLAGCTHNYGSMPITLIKGGFGGTDGLIKYLHNEAIDFLIDATHPFSTQISSNVANAAQKLGLSRLMLVRPQWENITNNWIEVDSFEIAAINLVKERSRRVFLAIGKQQLEVFSCLPHIWFLMRVVEGVAKDTVIPMGKLLVSKGPFDVLSEKQLLIDYQIDTIVSKNSGGNATYSKILSATKLGIKVIMIRRPQMPKGEKVTDVGGAMAWLSNKL